MYKESKKCSCLINIKFLLIKFTLLKTNIDYGILTYIVVKTEKKSEKGEHEVTVVHLSSNAKILFQFCTKLLFVRLICQVFVQKLCVFFILSLLGCARYPIDVKLRINITFESESIIA